MKPGYTWVMMALVGAAASLTTSLGLLALLLYLMATTPLIIRGGLVALSGLLAGFGAFWLFLMARALVGGGGMEEPPSGSRLVLFRSVSVSDCSCSRWHAGTATRT